MLLPHEWILVNTNARVFSPNIILRNIFGNNENTNIYFRFFLNIYFEYILLFGNTGNINKYIVYNTNIYFMKYI